MISIVTVNWNAYDFAKILVESVHWFSKLPHEIIVVDNSVVKQTIPDVVQIPQDRNVGHGEGLNIGSQAAQYPYTLFLDIDCHILTYGWEAAFLRALESLDVIGGEGVPAKPIRPACMFLPTEIARRYDWKDTPGYRGHRITPEGFDVAIQAYYRMLADGLKIGFFDWMPNRYNTINGEEWGLDGTAYCYHHWSGTYLEARQKDFPDQDLAADKVHLFTQLNGF
jgi:glycosyltransferase involved in cell wall biosynthesis